MTPAYYPAAPHCSDIAIDVGTALTRVAVGEQWVRQGKSVSAGRKALAGGVLVDREAAVEMLRGMLREARRWTSGSPFRVLACAPSDASASEKALLTECLLRAGASAVFIAAEPLAAAVGSAVDVASPYAKMLVDLGEGVTDCAIIRSAQIVTSHAVRTGCGDLRGAIRTHVRDYHLLEISDEEAERILRTVGVAGGSSSILAISGFRHDEPCVVRVPRGELQAALAPAKGMIVGAIKDMLQRLPDASAVEVIEDGICLSGGGALLAGMREEIEHALHVDVHVVSEPLRAVIRGAHAMLPVAATLRVWKG